MEEIDLNELLYYMLKRKVYIILSIIIGLVAGLLYTKILIQPEYSSFSTLLLSKSIANEDINDTTSNNDSTITQNDIIINQKLVSTYNTLIKSRSVATQVIQELGLNIKEEVIMSHITITSEEDSGMIKISFSSPDPTVTADVTNKLAEIFISKVKEIYNLHNFIIIDRAYVADTPYNINYLKNAALGGVLLLFLTICIIFMLFYFDTKIRSKEEVEKLLEEEVLAVIPEMKI